MSRCLRIAELDKVTRAIERVMSLSGRQPGGLRLPLLQVLYRLGPIGPLKLDLAGRQLATYPELLETNRQFSR